MELATPTGLAILRALQPRFVQGWPHGTLSATGIGAGSIELGRFANVLRVALIAEAESSEALLFETDQVFEVACNLDDQSPEKTAWVMEKAMERGALDCWVIPLVGKKGRPAVQLSMLVRPDDRDRFLSWILRVTTTFGVRFRAWDRWKLLKDIEEREAADGLPYRVSVGRTKDGTALKEKAEYEDVKRYWGTESSGQSE